jgi:hypothetical protein
MRRRSLRCSAPVCLAAAALAGCGSASPGLSASSAGGLRGQLAAVQTAAASGDRAAALNALSSFSAQVERDAGALSSAERTALRTGIARVRDRIIQTIAPPAATGASPTTSAPTATATSTAAPAVTTPTSPAPGPHSGGPNGEGPPGHPRHDGHAGGGQDGHGGGGSGDGSDH